MRPQPGLTWHLVRTGKTTLAEATWPAFWGIWSVSLFFKSGRFPCIHLPTTAAAVVWSPHRHTSGDQAKRTDQVPWACPSSVIWPRNWMLEFADGSPKIRNFSLSSKSLSCFSCQTRNWFSRQGSTSQTRRDLVSRRVNPLTQPLLYDCGTALESLERGD